MTEQQALRKALTEIKRYCNDLTMDYNQMISYISGTADEALAKNIDTASPSPASLHERMKTAIIELFHAEWSPGGHRYVEAQNAALRLGEELATPQPSPTGPREGEPPVFLLVSANEIAEFGALCVMNRQRKITAREAWDEYLENHPHVAARQERAPETATPSLPLQEPVAILDELIAMLVKLHPEDSPHEPTISYLAKKLRLALAAPSLPAVLTDAQIDDIYRASVTDTDIGFRRTVRKILALATSATPVLP